MYRPTKSGMGNSVVRLVFVSFDYFSNFQFPEKSSGRGDMTLCQQRDILVRSRRKNDNWKMSPVTKEQFIPYYWTKR
jgi:hypothetical protein